MKVKFVDPRGFDHKFILRYFNSSDGEMPDSAPGCYLLLSKNLEDSGRLGDYTVVYAGQSADICGRMYSHASEGASRFKGYWPSFVLQTVGADNFQLWRPEIEGDRRRYESFLYHYFVPLFADEMEHVKLKQKGMAVGYTNAVNLDLATGRLTWAR